MLLGLAPLDGLSSSQFTGSLQQEPCLFEEEFAACYGFPAIHAPALQCGDFIVGHTGNSGVVVDKSTYSIGGLPEIEVIFRFRVFVQPGQIYGTSFAHFFPLNPPVAMVLVVGFRKLLPYSPGSTCLQAFLCKFQQSRELAHEVQRNVQQAVIKQEILHGCPN